MSLKDQITADMKIAMREKDTARLGTIRLLLAAIKQREVDERIVLADTDVLAIIEKMLKQRRDAIAQFDAAGRQDLADAERAESVLLQGYMPQPLSADEIDAIIAAAIASSGASGAAAMGKVVALVKPQVAGRADMAAVSASIKAMLNR
jgi:uncharacterized protein YqeY